MNARLRRALVIVLWTITACVGFAVLLGLAALIILPSPWFRDKVRDRLVSEIQRSTGGRVDIGVFNFDWNSLTAEVTPFIVHGSEPANEAPLLRAESVRVGLRVVSMLKRDIDIAFLVVEQPRVNLLVGKDGITNLPVPKLQRKHAKDPIEELLDVAVGDISLRNGELHIGDRTLPLDFRGRYLTATLSYDRNGPAYNTTLNIREASAAGQTKLPANFSVASQLRLLKDRMEVQSARLTMRESSIDSSGSIVNLKAPVVNADVVANGAMSELGPLFGIPQPRRGQVNFTGKVSYEPAGELVVKGRLTGQHFDVRQDRVSLQNISVAANVDLHNRDLQLRDVTIHALDGVFHGAVDVTRSEHFRANGVFNDVSLVSLSRAAGLRNANFSGKISGPAEITGRLANGLRDTKVTGHFQIAAVQGGVPAQGAVEVAWDQRTNAVQLGPSQVALPHTRLQVQGTPGQTLTVRMESTDLNELKPAIEMATDKPAEELPISLSSNGSAVFDGTVAGPLANPVINGQVVLTGFHAADQSFDRLTATVNANASGAKATAFAVTQGTLRVAGNGEIALDQWKPVPASDVRAELKVEGASIATFLKQAKQNLPIAGFVSGQASVSGTYGAPTANMHVGVENPVLYDEHFERFTADIKYSGSGVEVTNGALIGGTDRVLVSGAYRHSTSDLKNGSLRFNVTTRGWRLQDIRALEKQRPGLQGRIHAEVVGLANVRAGEILPSSVNGTIRVADLSMDKRPLGNVVIDTHTTGERLTFALQGDFRKSELTGKGEFRLAGDYPGSGEMDLAPIKFSTVRDLVLTTAGNEPLPADGTLRAHMTFSGPAMKPQLLQAHIDVPELSILPSRSSFTRRQQNELTLKNQGPIVLDYDGKTLHVRSAHLVGPETDLRAAGSIMLREKNSSADIKIGGNVNLGMVQDLNRDIVSSGSAVISASVRGSLQDPQFGGQMEFKNASLYFADFPNGLDNLTGTVTFDERRATIERLTANTGGGELVLSGFLGFGKNETIYRLAARADRVRIRYPEGVSATANAALSLTGTSAHSLLSGVITLARAGFNPKSDIGGILASTPAQVAGPLTTNEFLRNMSLDVRVESVPNLQFQTSLTANIQADADLRLHGTAAKPTVLGRITVSRGDIEFFGNKYTITRGEIGFFNPVTIDPVLDINLETHARGVLVAITLNGTMKKLNFSYRSDPPLQSNEIIALLAMGRAPGTNSSLASSQTVSNTSSLNSGNSLVGQAVANPVSNRLQRFFGVSRLKIDPQLTGLSAIPQARLTVEQQVSRDITLTYVTNLAQANQQIIRLEWNLSRTWSVVAVREENGVFGVDFFFKKRVR